VSLPPAQECKALNGRLIDFLKRPENVAKLVMYVTEPASMTAEDKRQFKYPFASCEVRGFFREVRVRVRVRSSRHEPTSMTAEDKLHFKYPFASCEMGGVRPDSAALSAGVAEPSHGPEIQYTTLVREHPNITGSCIAEQARLICQ